MGDDMNNQETILEGFNNLGRLCRRERVVVRRFQEGVGRRLIWEGSLSSEEGREVNRREGGDQRPKVEQRERYRKVNMEGGRA